jgi:hypothetical protein
VTVIAAVPVFVSLVAVIVTGPTVTAATTPVVELTEAMLVLELDHVTTRPVSTLPLASRVVAASCTVPPTWRLEDAGETDTVATETGGSGLTVIVAPLLLPSLVAVT